MAYDDETMALLTDEERAALEEDEEIVGDETESSDEGAGEEAGETPEEAEAGADPQPDDDVSDEPVQDDGEAVATDEPEPAAPVLIAHAPQDLDHTLTEIAQRKEALIEQFDNGELTAKEYQQQVDALARQEREIERVKFKAELAEDIHRQQQANDWAAEVKRFTGDNKVYTTNKYAWNALDQAVREIANNPENASLSGRQILEKAHSELSEAFGWGKQAEAPAAKPTVQPKQPIKHAEPPPTLGKLPAAEMNDAAGNRFAALDRLMDSDPIAYEEALGRLSASERDAYLSA